jgi:hypothetical protein
MAAASRRIRWSAWALAPILSSVLASGCVIHSGSQMETRIGNYELPVGCVVSKVSHTSGTVPGPGGFSSTWYRYQRDRAQVAKPLPDEPTATR